MSITPDWDAWNALPPEEQARRLAGRLRADGRDVTVTDSRQSPARPADGLTPRDERPAMSLARKECPDGHDNTARLGRDAYGDDVHECYGCADSRSRSESFKFIVPRSTPEITARSARPEPARQGRGRH